MIHLTLVLLNLGIAAASPVDTVAEPAVSAVETGEGAAEQEAPSRMLPRLRRAPEQQGPPRFVADDAGLVHLAGLLWREGVACAGWQPWVPGPVPIVLTDSVTVGHGEAVMELRGASMPEVDFPLLTQIRLVPDTTLGVFAHELAHAWSGYGPKPLVEGKAEILGRCMLEGIGRGEPDRQPRMPPLPDLRAGEWEVDPYAYLAAARLVRVLDAVVPDRVLWRRKGEMRWEEIDAALQAAGPEGRHVLATLHGGSRSLRRALRDPDGDGRARLEEELGLPGEASVGPRTSAFGPDTQITSVLEEISVTSFRRVVSEQERRR